MFLPVLVRMRIRGQCEWALTESCCHCFCRYCRPSLQGARLPMGALTQGAVVDVQVKPWRGVCSLTEVRRGRKGVARPLCSPSSKRFSFHVWKDLTTNVTCQQSAAVTFERKGLLQTGSLYHICEQSLHSNVKKFVCFFFFFICGDHYVNNGMESCNSLR